MLSVEHVTKKYGKFTALEDMNLTFEKGVYGLLAPNGAGKTTLIKMLTTLLFPTEGRILWNGEDILALDEEYRGILGYLPQEFGYYRNYSPRQFLRYMAALQCMDRKKAEERIDALLKQVSLYEVGDKKLRQFSGGMIQRVGIAQAMLNDPKLLILDEPTAGLDPGERVRFRNLIHSLARDRIVILSTHIVSDIETIAGQIIMIRDHKLLCCDTPSAICSVLRGKLYQVPVAAAFSEEDILLSECQGEQGTMYRIVSDKPPQGAVQMLPNLEDAFLYYYNAGAYEGADLERAERRRDRGYPGEGLEGK